ncbi:MAG: hypothetical protein IPK80_33220 [Nannocystis sp.]|nr:hypothetical protein [Nannocystis sp.]
MSGSVRRAGEAAIVSASVLWCMSCGSGPKEPERRAVEDAPQEARSARGSVGEICAGEAVSPDPAGIPDNARLAVIVDLRDEELPAALERVEAWGQAPGGEVPVVAGLALSQIGFQLRLVRDLLAAIGIAPRSLLIVQAPGGELVWSFHWVCDLDGLRALLGDRWGLRSRSSVLGMIAEAAAPGSFAYDVVVLPSDQIALTPTGTGARLLRWLAGAEPSIDGRRAAGRFGEVLAEIPAAPVRAVLAWGGGSGVVVAGGGILRIRADGAQIEVQAGDL